MNSLGCAAVALSVFGFLAVLAWTGSLIGMDGARIEALRFFIEDIVVAALGRTGGAAMLVFVGLVIALPLAVRGLRS